MKGPRGGFRGGRGGRGGGRGGRGGGGGRGGRGGGGGRGGRGGGAGDADKQKALLEKWTQEISALGSTNFTFKQQRAHDFARLNELGAVPPKGEKMPLPMLLRMQRKRAKDVVRKEESDRAAGNMILKQKSRTEQRRDQFRHQNAKARQNAGSGFRVSSKIAKQLEG